MTLKEYYSLTKTTTKHLFKIVSAIFGGIFVVLIIVFAIKDSSSPDMGSIQMMLLNYLFVYGLTTWIFLCAFFVAYSNANGMIKLYNSIPLEIKGKFQLKLQEKQLDVKYNYLGFEIIGLYDSQVLCFDIFQQNTRMILYFSSKDHNNWHNKNLKYVKKHRKNYIDIYEFGLVKEIKKKKWNGITTEKIEQFLEEMKMKMIEQRENVFRIQYTIKH
jgi:hypothetical protein